MTAQTIVRHRSPGVHEIVGCDLSEAQAHALVEWGQAVWGPSVSVPPALYLLQDLDLHGLRYPAGWMLTVGYEIDEAAAVLLMRGTESSHVVSVPPGGVG